MNRRKFLTGMGMGAAALAIAPKLAFGQEAHNPRIITNRQTHAPGCFRLFKNGQQIGMIYWANLDTKEYRRTALESDFWEADGTWPAGPWDGGRIVNHPNQADKTTVTAAAIVIDSKVIMEARTYSTAHLPVVDYYHPDYDHKTGKTGKSPLTVENTFDEVYLTSKASAEIRAMYPDIKVRETKEIKYEYTYE